MNDRKQSLDMVAIHDAQKRFFESGATLPRAFREAQLRSLLAATQRHEARILEALWEDLHKPAFEAWSAEVAMIYAEIKHALKHLRGWMQPTRTFSPLVAQPSRSSVHPQPLGTTLILGAWNYPVQLTVVPVIPALAAGNVAVLKPSELAPASSSVIAEIIASALSPEVVAVVEGGVAESQALLELEWDHLFFTGGTNIGRIVAHAGAEHLSRVTLELGGKSPCIVTSKANIAVAARRIAWGKWMNCGQTCIAPDYLLVDERVHDELVGRIAEEATAMYGADAAASPDYGRMINARHFERVRKLIDPAKVKFGGQTDAESRFIAPTIMTDVTWEDAVMKQEIFGPILPVIKVPSLSSAIDHIKHAPNPLALYLFSEDSVERDTVIERVSFGGGSINNAMLHISDPNMPFGGVRTSGLGAYHGKVGFDRFTHYKAILESSTVKITDLPLKYAPFAGKLNKVKWLLG